MEKRKLSELTDENKLYIASLIGIIHSDTPKERQIIEITELFSFHINTRRYGVLVKEWFQIFKYLESENFDIE